jgi:hypothetical protein
VITEQEGKEVLDNIEELIVQHTEMILKELIKDKISATDDLHTMARNLVGKIGTRIMFGKEVTDDVLLKGLTVKTRQGHSPSNP